jgi:hypothetical protein
MSYMLTTLSQKREVDSIIRDTIDKVLVLRFGRGSDPICLHLDQIVCFPFLTFFSSCFSLNTYFFIFRILYYLQFQPFSFHLWCDTAFESSKRGVQICNCGTGWYWLSGHSSLCQIFWHHINSIYSVFLQCSSHENGLRVWPYHFLCVFASFCCLLFCFYMQISSTICFYIDYV